MNDGRAMVNTEDGKFGYKQAQYRRSTHKPTSQLTQPTDQLINKRTHQPAN